MLNGETIIINTSAPLREYMKRRPTHYAEILSEQNRVINVSSASWRKRGLYGEARPWEEKLFFRTPLTRLGPVNALNGALYRGFWRKTVGELSCLPILWNFTSGEVDTLRELPRKLMVLELCDDTPEFFEGRGALSRRVRENEEKMIRQADVVFAVSDTLREKRAHLRPDIHVVRNGADLDHFLGTPDLPGVEGDELYGIRSPVAGYAGAVAKWFDFDLIEAAARECPDVTFVFVGRIAPEAAEAARRLGKLANVRFPGEREYERLPDYLKYFDVTLIPFRRSSLVDSVNPIKLYEYLAAGKRVISTPLPEVVRIRKAGMIEIAADAGEFAAHLRAMLSGRPEEYVVPCREAAREHSWRSRVEEAGRIVREALDRNEGTGRRGR